MPLIRSVSGVRGIVRADDPGQITMTPAVAERMGRAFATFLARSGPPGRPFLVAGRDGRLSGDALLAAFAAGARSSGFHVVDLGVVTTPGVAMMVRHTGAAGGVVVTASHNPAQWNGLKFMTADGQAPPKSVAEEIFAVYDSGTFHQAQPAGPIPVVSDDPHDHHVEKVLQAVDIDGIRARRFHVVLDSINGAGAMSGRLLLERLGCRLIHINATAAANFAHTPEPIEDNLGDLCVRVRSEGVDIGFAQDPDADRLAVVDENGRYLGEEYTLALCARRVLATQPGPAAANLSTSRMIDDIAEAAGCPMHRSAVGEANVVAAMRAHHCVIGGEGNGGVIDPRVVYVRDSLVAMAQILDLLSVEKRPISAVADDVPRYCMLKGKLESRDPASVGQALQSVRQAFRDGHIDDTDGIRVDWPAERKWLHVRPSNTEPIVRWIVEAADSASANALKQTITELVTAAG